MGVAPTLVHLPLIVFIETGVVFFPSFRATRCISPASFFAAPTQDQRAALSLFALLPGLSGAHPIIGDQIHLHWIGHFFIAASSNPAKSRGHDAGTHRQNEAMIE